MYKCWWCHKNEKPYAFNLCLSCYRWFLRSIKTPPIRCSVCEVVITRKHEAEMMCVNCRKEIEQTLYKPKRITHMEDKYSNVREFLSNINIENIDPELQLTAIFKFKHRKLAKVICDRFYKQKTLQEVGEAQKVSREYIRQCEDKALKLLEKHVNGEYI